MRNIGDKAEGRALNFLRQQGLQILATNYSSRFGEVDIIALDKEVWVCVEVKYRRSNKYGDAAEFVTTQKQSRMIAAFQQYLMDKGRNPASTPIRLDVVAFNHENVQWLKNI